MGAEYRGSIVFIDEPATVQISGGIVHVRERSGGRRIKRTMSVATAEKTAERIRRALDRWAKGDQDIIVGD
jgi:hypothetical protein